MLAGITVLCQGVRQHHCFMQFAPFLFLTVNTCFCPDDMNYCTEQCFIRSDICEAAEQVNRQTHEATFRIEGKSFLGSAQKKAREVLLGAIARLDASSLALFIRFASLFAFILIAIVTTQHDAAVAQEQITCR